MWPFKANKQPHVVRITTCSLFARKQESIFQYPCHNSVYHIWDWCLLYRGKSKQQSMRTTIQFVFSSQNLFLECSSCLICVSHKRFWRHQLQVLSLPREEGTAAFSAGHMSFSVVGRAKCNSILLLEGLTFCECIDWCNVQYAQTENPQLIKQKT